MKDINDSSLYYEYLKSNIYNKMKSKILINKIKIEFNSLLDFFLDQKSFPSFLQKEMSGTFFITAKEVQNCKNNIDSNLLKYDSIIKITLSKTDKNISKDNNDLFFHQDCIHFKNFENHLILIFRYTPINYKTDNNKDSTENKNNFVDIIALISKDIEDNSSIFIQKIYSNFPDEIIDKFYEFLKCLSKLFEKYVYKNLKVYSCCESIVINNNLRNIVEYIADCKLFFNEKYKITDIKKVGEAIEVLFEIKDTIYPGSLCETKVIIHQISENSCYLLITNKTNINNESFNFYDNLLEIKPSIKMFLKLLRQRIEEKNKIKK